MTSSEIIEALVAKGYGVFIDPGDDGLDTQGEPYAYHVAVTVGEWAEGEWADLVIVAGTYSHDLEEALQEVWEEVQE